MKKLMPLVMVGFLMLAGAGCYSTSTTSNNTNEPSASASGRAVLLIKDAATALTNVTSVMLTVNKVEVHATSTGWVTVSSATKQYDLLQLKNTNTAQLLADVNLAAGTYDQIRLNISKVMVTASSTTQEAKLPSNILKIVGQLTIVAGQTSVASLDFVLDKSLHLTGNGKYILAPVVRLQTTKDADVKVEADESVRVSGGKIETDEEVGMDEKGETGVNLELPDKLKIDVSGRIERE